MALTLISTQTASSSSSIDFTSGIDSTYNEYLFTITNYKPVTDEQKLGWQTDTGTATSYAQTITSTAWSSGADQADSWTNTAYESNNDQDQGTALNPVSYSGESNSNADMTASGELRLFDPSNGTYVKHFMGSTNVKYTNNGTDAQTWCIALHTAGYVNTTTALTRVRFAALSGNIYTGTFTLYGVG